MDTPTDMIIPYTIGGLVRPGKQEHKQRPQQHCRNGRQYDQGNFKGLKLAASIRKMTITAVSNPV